MEAADAGIGTGKVRPGPVATFVLHAVAMPKG